MTADTTRAALTRYLESGHSDLGILAEDVIFTTMATGEEHIGRDAVRTMLEQMYRVAFDARAELRTLVCESEHAVLEALFVGRHTGEFAGREATGKEVRVPFCVVYDLAGGKIRRARVYLEIPVLLAQIAPPAGVGHSAPTA